MRVCIDSELVAENVRGEGQTWRTSLGRGDGSCVLTMMPNHRPGLKDLNASDLVTVCVLSLTIFDTLSLYRYSYRIMQVVPLEQLLALRRNIVPPKDARNHGGDPGEAWVI